MEGCVLIFSCDNSKIATCCWTTGEGNGNPLQYSCLENPKDGGAWKATVHGVAKSWTRLSDFTFIFHLHALKKEMATHSSIHAWRISGTEEPVGLPSMGSQSRTRLTQLSSSSSNSGLDLVLSLLWLWVRSLVWKLRPPQKLWCGKTNKQKQTKNTVGWLSVACKREREMNDVEGSLCSVV